jgi:hypothetical protein
MRSTRSKDVARFELLTTPGHSMKGYILAVMLGLWIGFWATGMRHSGPIMSEEHAQALRMLELRTMAEYTLCLVCVQGICRLIGLARYTVIRTILVVVLGSAGGFFLSTSIPDITYSYEFGYEGSLWGPVQRELHRALVVGAVIDALVSLPVFIVLGGWRGDREVRAPSSKHALKASAWCDDALFAATRMTLSGTNGSRCFLTLYAS